MEKNYSVARIGTTTADFIVTSVYHRFVSDDATEIFQWIFFAVISEIMCCFGTVTNIVNIICFLKTGLKDVVNISLLEKSLVPIVCGWVYPRAVLVGISSILSLLEAELTICVFCVGLSISDLGCLVPLIWSNICYNPAFNRLDLSFEPIEFQYLTGAWLHVTFTRVTSCITAFITLERCLCITIPLKVKAIFTHKRVTAIIASIFIILIINVIPVYYANRLDFKFSPARNKTLIGLVFTDDREQIESIVFSISNVFVLLSAFATIVVCTVILVVSLHLKSQWRQASTGNAQSESANSRDQKVVKMVILISALFIACFAPVCLIITGMIVEPEFSIGGNYRNLFISVCSIGFALEATNSSINIFIYYHMSTKYRTVFRQLFHCRTDILTRS